MPIIGIVLVLCFSIAPIPNSVLMTFVVGAVLLIIGMMFFTLGAEMAMTPMGERIGTKLTNTRKIIDKKLEVLKAACDQGDDLVAKEALRSVVPTFRKPEDINKEVDKEEHKNKKEEHKKVGMKVAVF